MRRLVALALAIAVLGGHTALASGPNVSASTTFFEYVRRGLSGGARSTAVPVPAALSAPANAIATARPALGAALPAGALVVDRDVAGAYLDAKDRATVRSSIDESASSAAWISARAKAPGRPALEPGQDAVAYFAQRLAKLLAPSTRPGAAELRANADLVQPSDSSAVPLLQAYGAVVEAVESSASADSVLGVTAAAAGRVADTPVPTRGSFADAVLVAATSNVAPESSREAARFSAVAPSSVPSLPADVLAAQGSAPGGSLAYESGGQPRTVAAESWTPRRRADGAVYYVAEPSGDVALTDGSLLGWGFDIKRAYLVDARDVGRILAVYPAP